MEGHDFVPSERTILIAVGCRKNFVDESLELVRRDDAIGIGIEGHGQLFPRWCRVARTLTSGSRFRDLGNGEDTIAIGVDGIHRTPSLRNDLIHLLVKQGDRHLIVPEWAACLRAHDPLKLRTRNRPVTVEIVAEPSPDFAHPGLGRLQLRFERGVFGRVAVTVDVKLAKRFKKRVLDVTLRVYRHCLRHNSLHHPLRGIDIA